MYVKYIEIQVYWGEKWWIWACFIEWSTKIAHHKIYVIVFIPEMFHQLLKALFFSANLKHTFSLWCEIPKISIPKLDADILAWIIISRISVFFPLLHTIYLSSKQVNSQIATWARANADPGFFCKFSWYFEIHIKCEIHSLVIFAGLINIFSLHLESHSVTCDKKPTIQSTNQPF